VVLVGEGNPDWHVAPSGLAWPADIRLRLTAPK
jgi:hypothetical protein